MWSKKEKGEEQGNSSSETRLGESDDNSVLSEGTPSKIGADTTKAVQVEELITTRPVRPTQTYGSDPALMDRADRELYWTLVHQYEIELGKYIEDLKEYQKDRRGGAEPKVYDKNLHPLVMHGNDGRPILEPGDMTNADLQAFGIARDEHREWNHADGIYSMLLKRNAEAMETAFVSLKTALLNKSKGDKLTKDTWLADTGASSHMTPSMDGLYDVEYIKKPVKMGNKQVMWAVARGKKNMIALQKDGLEPETTLEDVLVVPELGYNLFALNRVWKKGDFTLLGDKQGLRIRKGKFEMTFDQHIRSGEGILVGVKLIPSVPTSTNRALILKEGSQIKYEDYHSWMGHLGETQLRATAKQMGITLIGTPEHCEHCATAKARQKNVPKAISDEKGSSKPGERLFFDISSVKATGLGGSKYWLLVVDDATDMTWSIFLKKKSELSKKMLDFLSVLKTQGISVSYFRCDNGGENVKFQAECAKKGWNVDFEFTAPGTPQQNSKGERKFATLWTLESNHD